MTVYPRIPTMPERSVVAACRAVRVLVASVNLPRHINTVLVRNSTGTWQDPERKALHHTEDGLYTAVQSNAAQTIKFHLRLQQVFRHNCCGHICNSFLFIFLSSVCFARLVSLSLPCLSLVGMPFMSTSRNNGLMRKTAYTQRPPPVRRTGV